MRNRILLFLTDVTIGSELKENIINVDINCSNILLETFKKNCDERFI